MRKPIDPWLLNSSRVKPSRCRAVRDALGLRSKRRATRKKKPMVPGVPMPGGELIDPWSPVTQQPVEWAAVQPM